MSGGSIPRRVSTAEAVLNPGLFAGCAIGIGAWVVAALIQPPGADILRHVAFFLVSFAFYLAAVWLIVAAERSGMEMPGSALVLGLVWAVALRLALLATAPSLSDDIFRYVWDGKVANAGIDPYAFPPAAPELAGLRSPLWNGINHKEMATPYPPLAEGLFSLVYRLVPDSLTGMQAAAVLFDAGVIAVLVGLLTRMGMNRGRALIYAWNPLILVQFAHSGHFDSAMLLPLLASLLFLSGGHRVLSGLSLGVSVLVKLVPALAGPLFLPAWGVAGTLAAGAAVAAGTVPFLGSPALSGLLSEASDARFNDSVGYVMVRVLGLITADPDSVARAVSAVALAIASLSAAFFLWKRGADWKALPRAIYYVLGLFLLLNAVVEPWYFTWILPFLCLTVPSQRGRLRLSTPWFGWLLLTGLVILTDLTYVHTIGNSAWVWVRAAEYGPLIILLGVWLWHRRAHILPPLPIQSRTREP